jgi:hypothetical protein
VIPTFTRVCLVEGTWGAKWAEPGSVYRKLLCRSRFEIMGRTDFWSGDVSGIPSITSSQKHSDWKIGGAFLAEYLSRKPYEDRNIICHSHGAQVALYAAACEGLKIRRLISVCAPVRKDMQSIAAFAKPNVGFWVHVHAECNDWTQFWGECFDGAFGWTRKQPFADVNISIPKIGHSGLFMDEDVFHHWPSLLAYIKLSDQEVGARRVC